MGKKKTGGQLIIECLESQGADRVFCVPGESYLAVLDGLFDSQINVINARHEGGAAIMAEADGKMTSRPGICMVTRGPGATNAACGVHIAKQDSTPMILFVGQIARDMRGREAFQEVDYRQTFRDLAKWVEEIDQVDRIPEIINHAYHVAMSGRPGPVVLALPEDMLREETERSAGPRVEVAAPAPTHQAIEDFALMLEESSAPFLVLGGSRWDEQDVEAVQEFAERLQLPVGCSFRRQHLFNHQHSNYAGDVGLGINPALKARIASSDLLIVLGARFSENPSQGFSLLDIPKPKQKLVHIHPGAEELGRIYTPTLAINATPRTFLEASTALKRTKETPVAQVAHADYQSWSSNIPQRNTEGYADAGAIVSQLRTLIDKDAIITNGAGNYSIWLHRFWHFQRFGSQLAPISGSMGYGLPAAIAAKCRNPDRTVICFAGDGCFQMTAQEFATAVQTQAAVIVLIFDNSLYGTIRMHQERNYPGRPSATALSNPDFAAMAIAFGGFGETVSNSDEFEEAFSRAKNSNQPAVIHILTDPNVISPTQVLPI